MNERQAAPNVHEQQPIRLGEIAHARSGDKGPHANVGVIAFTPEGFDYLGRVLTETRVAQHFLSLRPREVERYLMPGIRAYNFVLRGVIPGGASRSLHFDNQGKTIAASILEMELPRPANLPELLSAKPDK